jgi:hypothetical protein
VTNRREGAFTNSSVKGSGFTKSLVMFLAPEGQGKHYKETEKVAKVKHQEPFFIGKTHFIFRI